MNAKQNEALHMLVDEGRTVKVVGPAGSGETVVAEAFIEAEHERDAGVVCVWLAPYNSQVDSAKERARARPRLWRALRYGRNMRTAASVFKFPLRRRPVAKQMVAQMSATTKAMLRAPNLRIVLDEVDLLTPARRDQISEALVEIRGDPRPDGSVQVCEVCDMFQGEPYTCEAEKEMCQGAFLAGPRRELTIEGVHMDAPGRAVCFLEKTERFKEQVYQDGSKEHPPGQYECHRETTFLERTTHEWRSAGPRPAGPRAMPASPARLHVARPWSARLRRPVPRAQARTHAALAAWLTTRPGADRPEILEQETATKATEKHASMVDSIEAAPIAAKDAHARHPRPAPNRTETVPCRAPFPQASTHSLTPAQTRTGDLTFWSRTP